MTPVKQFIKASRANYQQYARELDELFVSFAATNPPTRILWAAWKLHFRMKWEARRLVRDQIRLVKEGLK